MRHSLKAASACSLIAVLLLLPIATAPRPAAAAPAPLSVAVVRSEIALGASATNYGDKSADGSLRSVNEARIARVADLLGREPGMAVTIIGDAELSNVAALRPYDVVVLVRDVATIESQRFALLQYATEGGGVVSMFSTSRYDYRPGQRSPYGDPRFYSAYGTPYFQFNFAWGFSGSSLMSQSFEYGEVSELLGTRFCNDPYFYPNYQVVGNSPSTHPILQMTATDLGRDSFSLTDGSAQYNETVWPIKNVPVTPLMNFSGETLAGGGGIESHNYGYGAATHMAAWAMPYYFGKVVAYGFQLYDLVGQPAAVRMLVNSVKWAGTREGYGPIRKNVGVSVNADYSGGRIRTTAGVSNGGTIQVRGQLKAEFFRPGASAPFDSCYITDRQGWIPTSPGERYSAAAGRQPSVAASPGRWRVRVSYRYYDYFGGGFVTVYRDGYLDGSGSGMTWRGQGPQVFVAWPKSPPPGSSELAGADRFATAAAISQAGWPSGVTTSGAVVLTSGVKFPDALAAAPLAGRLNAPIVLAGASSLPASALGELDRLYRSAPATPAAKLYVVGAMPPSVVASARAAIARAGAGGRAVETVMLAGADRYDTARLVARAIGPSPTPAFADTVFVATGLNYADALSAAPIAAHLGVPILFVGKTVPPSTAQALDELGVKHAVILGSAAAVSEGIAGQLAAGGHRAAGDARLAGPTRFDTCVRILEYAIAQGGLGGDMLYVATGTNYPDALALAPLAGAGRHPVLLVNGADIGSSAAAAAYLSGRRTSPPQVTFVGGPAAVSGYVRGQVGVALLP